jgi:hypothetical protein
MNRKEVIEALAKGPSGDVKADAALMRAAAQDMRDLFDWFNILSRACGNWRTWPGQADDGHDHPDWKAAARAIIERDQKQAALKAVEDWWLSEGMKHFTGAPYAIFAAREALRG